MRKLFWNFRAHLLAIEAYQKLPDLDFPKHGEGVEALNAVLQHHQRKMVAAMCMSNTSCDQVNQATYFYPYLTK